MDVIFLVYRSWAIKVCNVIKSHPSINEYKIIKNQKKFLNYINKKKNSNPIIILIGWSNILDSKIVENFFCVGVHPSDLPHYRGGSPIQHQIIDGKISSKVSLYKLTNKIDSGGLLFKEKFSLMGDSMNAILKNLEISSINLLLKFFDKYPKIKIIEQKIKRTKIYQRRLHKDSKIYLNEFKSPNLKKLYNKIRCLTNPYPNAYIEDKKGNRLFFTGVKIKYEK